MMTNEDKIKLVQRLQSGNITNEEKIAIIQQLQGANTQNIDTPKKGFFQRIKDSMNEAYERERALEAADPIAYRQMKAMESMASDARHNRAEMVRLQGLQQSRNAMMKAALMTGNTQLMRNAMICGL